MSLSTKIEPIMLLWLKYEIYCVLLNTMNAHSIYTEESDRQLFYTSAPLLLKRLLDSSALFVADEPHLSMPMSTVDVVKTIILSEPTPTPDEELVSLNRIFRRPSRLTFNASSTSTFTKSSFSQSSPLLDDPSTDIDRFMNTLTSPCLTNPTKIPLYHHLDRQSLSMETYLASTSPNGPNCPIAFLSRHSRAPFSGAYLFVQLAWFHYGMCDYDTSYRFTLLGIRQVRASLSAGNRTPSPLTLIELLRVMCKLVSIKRLYVLADEICLKAINYTRTMLGTNNPTFAILLLEYGNLMLNTDKIYDAASTYRTALGLIISCLPGANSLCALALDAIAYSGYVLEYTSGLFDYALSCAEAAGRILRRLNQASTMQAASTNRIKALIIEEIAIDERDSTVAKTLLCSALNLHLEALRLCEKTFGSWNIQTAKHFGNLGRLYQTMREKQDAELMHKKAILIKEFLLGEWDYEVGISVGHLASLYNYDMERLQEAERLYLRSVAINTKLFGLTYSGLEYDYMGLQRIYREQGRDDDFLHYRALYVDWHDQRLALNEAHHHHPTPRLADSDDSDDNLSNPPSPSPPNTPQHQSTTSNTEADRFGFSISSDWFLALTDAYVDQLASIFPTLPCSRGGSSFISDLCPSTSPLVKPIEFESNRSSGV